ncbi:MAG: ABC transporter substrate-binding protein [Dehalococcoidales bacterium]|nr:ABC transporter substrate-binding protein [Dehalococcoidales bacterium]
MKRLLIIVLAIVVIGSLFVFGCGKEEAKPTATTAPTKTATPTATAPQTQKPTEPAKTTAPAPGTPKRGGTLRVLGATGVSNLSWVPKQSMTDETMAKAYAETLVYYSGSGDFKPELAESWDIDPVNKTLTFHLRRGVKFHDGTPFNAEAVRWNVQNLIDSKRLANGQYVDSIEVVDDYTFRYHLNAMLTPSIMLHSYGYNLLTMFSPTAFQKNGGEAWATSHYVSTGPFKFESWTQDVSMRIVRFDDYWRGNPYPYLDAIEFTFVADATLASAKMQAGEADAWAGPPLKEATDLKKMPGFTLITGVGGFYSEIIPDNASEGSVYKDPRVRQAIEYAIDRDALADGLGYGILKAVKQAGGPATSQGYNPKWPIREYNVQKAKELLAQAGYPNGFKTKLLVMQGGQQDMAQAIQSFLGEVGIEVEIDVADPGRFIGAIYKGGWNGGLLLWMVPVDPEFAIGWFVHFGPQPIFPYPSLKWPDEYYKLVEKVRLAPTVEEMRAATMEMMTLVSEGAYIIPLMESLNLYVVRDYVRTNRYKDHFMVWHNYEDWLDK